MRLTNRKFAGLIAGLAMMASVAPAMAQTGSVKGTFVLEGEAPELPPKIKAGDNVKDGAVCAADPVPNQTLVVDPATKGVANVFIWIARFDEKDIPADLKKPAKATLEIDQKGCVFVPHCVIARTGQTLVMLNGDAVAHNVHVNAIRGDSINDLVAPNDREGVKRELKKADILPVPVTCDIHPWMKAHMLVLDHPYGAVSNEKGQFEITGLPPGKYDFKIWQEAAGYLRDIKADDIEVKAGGATDLGNLKVDVKKLKDL